MVGGVPEHDVGAHSPHQLLHQIGSRTRAEPRGTLTADTSCKVAPSLGRGAGRIKRVDEDAIIGKENEDILRRPDEPSELHFPKCCPLRRQTFAVVGSGREVKRTKQGFGGKGNTGVMPCQTQVEPWLR